MPVSSRLISVGIDIGTTTTHLVFSKLLLRYIEQKHKFEVVEREITYRSRVAFTPYLEEKIIDTETLSSILKDAYSKAGQTPNDIDTGVIMITGEAARKNNAAKIANLFAGQLGKFVCATAGANYEAILSAYGSGAVQQSAMKGITIMNIDIGGGTTKIAVVCRGEVLDTACISIGARLIIINNSAQILRVEDAARPILGTNGINHNANDVLSEQHQNRIAATMAKCLIELIMHKPLSNLTKELMVTAPLNYSGRIDEIFFSGGVSEYIYGYTKKHFGDIGRILGHNIRKETEKTGIPIHEPVERIRATVMGASNYTLQVSGNTTFVSNQDWLPLRNLPVVSTSFQSAILTENGMAEELRKGMQMHDINEGKDTFAFAFPRTVISQPSYVVMKALGTAIISVLSNTIKRGNPVVLIFEADIGMGMGRLIKKELEPNCNLVSVDEITLQTHNFIDIGCKTENGFLPVVVKSLIFKK